MTTPRHPTDAEIDAFAVRIALVEVGDPNAYQNANRQDRAREFLILQRAAQMETLPCS